MRNYLALGLGIYISFCSLCYGQISDPFGELLIEDTLSFDPIHEWITIPVPEENIWQIGQANKQFLDSSLTGASVILTDTIDSYPILVDDYFRVSIPQLDEWYSWAEGILSFYHKYQTDSLSDGGLIEVTYDGGESWENVLYDYSVRNPSHIGLYSESDTIVGGHPAFSGTANDWAYTELHWVWYALVKKTNDDIVGRPTLRFRFISDSIDTKKDGWLIDHLVFRGYDVSGSLEDRFEGSAYIYPNPTTDFFYLKASEYNEDVVFRLFSSDGKLQMNVVANTPQRIDVSGLSPGIYPYYILIDNEHIESGKLVKK